MSIRKKEKKKIAIGFFLKTHYFIKQQQMLYNKADKQQLNTQH